MAEAAKTNQKNIYQKLATIRKQVEVIQKDKAGYNYRYVSDETILAKVTAYMDKLNLTLVPGISPGSLRVAPHLTKETKTTNKGEIFEKNVNEVIVFGDMVYTWVNNDNPEERITVPWGLVGQQGDASQAFGSGLSYSQRYFLLKYFNTATPEDDPDKWRAEQARAAAAEDEAIAQEIIANLDTLVKAYLEQHSDEAASVKKFFSGYVKGGNYFSIRSSQTAAKVLADFKTTILKEE